MGGAECIHDTVPDVSGRLCIPPPCDSDCHICHICISFQLSPSFELAVNPPLLVKCLASCCNVHTFTSTLSPLQDERETLHICCCEIFLSVSIILRKLWPGNNTQSKTVPPFISISMMIRKMMMMTHDLQIVTKVISMGSKSPLTPGSAHHHYQGRLDKTLAIFSGPRSRLITIFCRRHLMLVSHDTECLVQIFNLILIICSSSCSMQQRN